MAAGSAQQPAKSEIDALESLLFKAAAALGDVEAGASPPTLAKLESLISQAQQTADSLDTQLLAKGGSPVALRVGASVFASTAIRTVAETYFDRFGPFIPEGDRSTPFPGDVAQSKVVQVRLRAQPFDAGRVLTLRISAADTTATGAAAGAASAAPPPTLTPAPTSPEADVLPAPSPPLHAEVPPSRALARSPSPPPRTGQQALVGFPMKAADEAPGAAVASELLLRARITPQLGEAAGEATAIGQVEVNLQVLELVRPAEGPGLALRMLDEGGSRSRTRSPSPPVAATRSLDVGVQVGDAPPAVPPLAGVPGVHPGVRSVGASTIVSHREKMAWWAHMQEGCCGRGRSKNLAWRGASAGAFGTPVLTQLLERYQNWLASRGLRTTPV